MKGPRKRISGCIDELGRRPLYMNFTMQANGDQSKQCMYSMRTSTADEPWRRNDKAGYNSLGGTVELLGSGAIMGDMSALEECSSANEWAPPADTWRTGMAPRSTSIGTSVNLVSVLPSRPWLKSQINIL